MTASQAGHWHARLPTNQRFFADVVVDYGASVEMVEELRSAYSAR